MLIGFAENLLDKKGRLTLATKWREELDSGVFITRGIDKCLFVYPQDQFQKFVQELDTQKIGLAVVRAFMRHLAALAEYVKPDAQGRIGLSRNLCKFAGLDDQVVVIGAIDHLEVWAPKLYAEVNAQSEQNASAIAEEYGEKIYNRFRN